MGRVLARGPCYHITLSSSDSKIAALCVRTTPRHWHARLVHPSLPTSYVISSRFNLPIFHFPINMIDECISYSVSKAHRSKLIAYLMKTFFFGQLSVRLFICRCLRPHAYKLY